LVYKTLPSDDPKQRQPDITFARQTLSWEPEIALRDGLMKTIGYFDEMLNGQG
jgi:UDP-glucuronate decarboxylase